MIAGDEQRQQQDVDREAQHRLAQRRLVEHDLDELAAHRRRADHPHHVVVAAEQRLEGIDDGAMPRHVAHVDVVVDRRAASRTTASRRRCWPIFIATARAPMLSRIWRASVLRHHAARRGVEHERGGMGGGEPVVAASSGGNWRSTAHRSALPRSSRTGIVRTRSLPDRPRRSRRARLGSSAAAGRSVMRH